MEKSNIQPYSINSIEHITFRNDKEYEAIKNETEELSKIARDINCPYIVVVPGKLPESSTKNKIKEESVKVLKELGDYCRQI